MKQKKSIAFLTTDFSKSKSIQANGCAWYRCVMPGKELAKRGFEIAVAIPDYDENHGFGALISEDKRMFDWDVVVFKLIMHRNILEIMKNKRPDQKIFVDVDDFYEDLRETNFAYSTTDPSKNDDINRDIYLEIIDMADGVITSTQFLYDYYKKNKGVDNVYLVRNSVSLDQWHKKGDHSRWLPTFGWVGAIPWRSNDLEEMSPFFGKFLEKNRLSFHHAGHIKNLNKDIVQMMGIPDTVKITKEPRRLMSEYPQMFRKINVGIVPLSNIPFNHAKSTIKGLEYAASGIPFVSSWSPEYELLANQGIGRVANNEDEWLEILEELINPKTRKEESEKNYELLKENHTIDSRADEWENVFNEIIDQ